MLTNIDRLADPVPAAAERLGISRSRLYREIKAGKITALKAGGRTLISRASQEQWLAALPIAEICSAYL